MKKDIELMNKELFKIFPLVVGSFVGVTLTCLAVVRGLDSSNIRLSLLFSLALILIFILSVTIDDKNK